MGEVGSRREYGRRRRMSGRRTGFITICLTNALFQLTRDHGRMPWWGQGATAGLVLAILGWAALLHWRGRTVADAEGITAYNALRSRHFPWPAIYDIRIEPLPKQLAEGPRHLARLYTEDGRRTRLPFLDDWQQPGLYGLRREVDTLRETAAQQRGTPWEHRPEVETRIRRRAGHRKAWERSVLGTMLVLLVMFLLLLTEPVSGAIVRPLLLLVYVPAAAFTVLAALLHWQWKSQVPRYMRGP
ncbi:PH domain-containing protein [Streptomyces griseus]|uniref:PH domain-containing protein n=1 Tax=Streptomyces griseus TaxID=1911 RepID=UPI00068F599C|nr:PH domain-containing protein [Streptomyces griseus]